MSAVIYRVAAAVFVGALFWACSGERLERGMQAHALAEPCIDGDANVQDFSTGRCYMYFDGFENLQTWDEAQARCAELPGTAHLATITSAAESVLILEIVPFDRDRIWVGGSEQAVENEWLWITGEAVEYENWDPELGEPNNGGLGHCIAVSGEDGQWHDRDCGDTLTFLCEREPEPELPDAGPVPSEADAGSRVADAAPAEVDAALGSGLDDDRTTTSLYDCAITPGSRPASGHWLWLMALLAALGLRRR